MGTKYHLGIDVGSTTVKVAVLNEDCKLVYSRYARHYSEVRGALHSMLRDMHNAVRKDRVTVSFTGSGGMGMADALGMRFTQEVISATTAIAEFHPQTDVAIELGGEDAKIIYLTDGIEQRMNGICAGGTGAFIDQMATLLKTDAAGLSELARDHKTIHPVAARCGVFAKTDIQPLLNEGVPKADIAASIFQAVVIQTISGLACGRPVRGTVAFLGGPLAFLPELRRRFAETLALSPEQTVFPEHAELFVAMGAALAGRSHPEASIVQLMHQLSIASSTANHETARLEPLFASAAEHRSFVARHEQSQVKRGDLAKHTGPCYLGIDAGSTTTKICVIDGNGAILHTHYTSNGGSPLESTIDALLAFYEAMPEKAHVANATVTGYGEGLIKSALNVDEGEIETLAHYKAAEFFCPGVDFVLDIGGQDMKSLRVRGGVIDSILLNEACSSGCGSFLDTFAASLGYGIKDFAEAAVHSKNPVDLGSRCTVFMNSRVKQAQKEGAGVDDISAGLSYSVIKNALFKVIRLRDPDELGERIVVQGGTFYNDAVLRAFELLSKREVIRPPIAGIMGAFGAALIARERCRGMAGSTILSPEKLSDFTIQSSTARCQLCPNSCILTVHTFPGANTYISGNRCERGSGKAGNNLSLPNLFAYKHKRLFEHYRSTTGGSARRGRIGLPRVLNIYENYPFWHTLFTQLGFTVQLSAPSSTSVYEKGMETIPSESVCYPAKLAHGHIVDLIDAGCDLIFYPSIVYEAREQVKAENNFNCPIVISYPETIKNNVYYLRERGVTLLKPFLPYEHPARMTRRLWEELRYYGVERNEVKAAVRLAYREQHAYKRDIQRAGEIALQEMKADGMRGIVLAGRPYHLDPQINRGIPEMINSLGMGALTEDSISHLGEVKRPLRVVDQWTYHSRLYAAAAFVSKTPGLELVQLNSFGCGLDAITTDQTEEILRSAGKVYTCLKIDEGTSLGAVRIRLRSLLASMNERSGNRAAIAGRGSGFVRNEFTPVMRKKHTILVPQMSPMHFQFLQEAFRQSGYNLVVLPSDDKAAVEVGLKYVNNDACYPSILVIGQLIEALQSGCYDPGNTSVMISQTGGGCRATNYIGLLRKALVDAGFGHVPVISLSATGLEKNSGFRYTPRLLHRGMMAVMYGDVLMNLLYRVRPYEKFSGSANRLYEKWVSECLLSLRAAQWRKYTRNVKEMVREFEELAITDTKKPRVGLVGEILVKYHPTANNDVVKLVEKEGAEAVMPGLMDFLLYSLRQFQFQHRYLAGSWARKSLAHFTIKLLEVYRYPYRRALKSSRRFLSPKPIEEIASAAEKVLSLGHQTGEGWFLTGEMIELMESGIKNIICMQPFACLPNHVTGKGMIKELRRAFPGANIVAVDYDPGASEVNQLNRIRLMISNAFAAREFISDPRSLQCDAKVRSAGVSRDN